MSTLSLREASLADCELLYNWRNLPEIYMYFFNPSKVDWEEHSHWYQRALKDEKVAIYIAEWSGEPCGMVKFQHQLTEKSAEVGIYVLPHFFGQGLGGKMLLAGEKCVRQKWELAKIAARVLPENERSIKMFKKCQYEEKYVHLEKFFEARE